VAEHSWKNLMEKNNWEGKVEGKVIVDKLKILGKA
jgi:hypothetical protein